MSQMSKNAQPFIIDAISTNGESVGSGANKASTPGQELLFRVASDIKVAAHSTESTLSSDTSFAKQLQIGDIVISFQAAANQVETVTANGTLPAGFSGTNLLALAWRPSANNTN
jgi:hypothetical protein